MKNQSMRTDITPDKVRNMAHFELVLDPMDSTMNALLKVLHFRREYAKAFGETADESLLDYIKICNENIKLILSL